MKVRIHYAKTSEYSTFPLVKKVYLPADERVIVKARHSGQTADTVTDFDFRNLPTEVELIERAFSEMLHRVSVVNSEVTADFVFAVADAASVNFTDRQDSDITSGFPNYVYTASGETETTETGGTVPTWLGSSTVLTAMRSKWFARLGDVYRQGLRAIEPWWEKTYQIDSTDRQRSRDIMEVELPNWWRAGIQCVSAAVSGRNWTTMTATQIEACVAHLESLLAGGIIETWYRVGLTQTVSNTTRIPGTTRDATGYSQASTIGTASLYTDLFSVVSDVLTARTPDYAWLPIVCTTPSNFNPESPS